MEFDKKILDHTIHDWTSEVAKAVHTITPGVYIIAGIERHRLPVRAATLATLEEAGSVDPNVIPRHPMILQTKPFKDFYWYDRLNPEDVGEAFGLARFRPVIVEMHTMGLRNTFRRLEAVRVHEADLGLIRGTYALTGVPSDIEEAVVNDIRFFDDEATLAKARADEFEHSSERYFIGDALRHVSTIGISIEDVKERFRNDDVVGRVQSLCVT
ncbi:hypothetical protein G6L37_34685 [Agrobacterium rubi]|nr:hypothetical protein [Agrobacterium rubi]NTF23715.1 hypothetical protein [Agrobacterium rubi]